jgi:hypothetical protein
LHLAKLQKLKIKPRSIKLQNLKLIVYFKMYTCKLESELSSNTKLERASIFISQISLKTTQATPEA